jgi:N-acyl-D-amino-acid deacylase
MERQAEMILDLAASGGAQMIYFDMSEDDVEEIMKYPVTVFGSDSAVREDNMRAVPHPRGLGTFPRVFSRYVRGRRALTLEEAVRRMTSLPATIFGIKDRGRIAEGCWADLVVFDERIVEDQADYRNPLSHPKGIYVVIVNGTPVFENGRFTKAAPARPLHIGAD